MPDQNQNLQNSIPGTLRTLKTDLENLNNSPQDRLQQAGNFVQARPSTNLTQNITPTKIDSNIENKVVEKKDIPLNNLKPDNNYSWSNMNPVSGNPNTDDIKNVSDKIDFKPNSEIKPSFSVLDSNIDFPLDDKNKQLNINTLNNNGVDPSQVNPLKSEIDNQNKFDKNIFNTQDNIDDSKKSSVKKIISVVTVVVLLVLIGGGIYLFNRSRVNNNITTSSDTNPTPKPNPISNTTVIPLFANIPKLDISFINTEPIRQTILTQLNNKKDSLIELNLTKDGNKVSLVDLSDALSITLPSDILNNAKEYWLYGYNQQGIYKLTAVIQINDDQNISESIDNWSTSIPRDLSGFSINSPSRIVNIPTIKQSSIVNSSGKTFKNYYYNYTSPTDSIDVSSYENYLLMGSSQESMKSILEKIK